MTSLVLNNRALVGNRPFIHPIDYDISRNHQKKKKKSHALKVGSCPNNIIDTKFCFVLFCVVFEEIYDSGSVAVEKTARFCLEFTFFFIFFFFFYMCSNSDSKNSFVTCP